VVWVTDAQGERVASFGGLPGELGNPFSATPDETHETPGYFFAWAEAKIEGEAVGRAVAVVSKNRLVAGQKLRRNIMLAGAADAVIALFMSFLLVRTYVTPLIRVTVRAFRQLEKTTAQALEAAELKSRFLANMSHEIRTPMNGVVGMIELLLQTGLIPQQRRYVETIRRSAKALLVLLNDLLDISKIEAGKLEIEESECDLVELVEDVV
jgi:signal transduction histidine kinase